MGGKNPVSRNLMQVATGKLDGLDALLEKMQQEIASATVKTPAEGLHEDETATSEDGYLIATIVLDELWSLLMYRRGEFEVAIGMLQAAAAKENARPLEYGPPYIPKPCSELLGEMLLAQGRPPEAITAFENPLLRNTNRSLSLLGLARAREAAGQVSEEADTRALLASLWKGDLADFLESGYPWLGR